MHLIIIYASYIGMIYQVANRTLFKFFVRRLPQKIITAQHAIDCASTDLCVVIRPKICRTESSIRKIVHYPCVFRTTK